MYAKSAFLAVALAIGVTCLPAPQATAAGNSSAPAASAAPGSSAAAPRATAGITISKVARDIEYKAFKGDGSTDDGWPDKKDWVPFEDAFSANEPTMLDYDSQDEVDQIKSAIKSISADTDVDERFILAVIMQESRGNVRVGTTSVTHPNPGLMQSHEGVDCIDQTPCPEETISQMIKDGTEGTDKGDGLKQGLTGDDAEAVYKAARIYNSGSPDASGDLAANGATPCYCSDVANRLIGFLGDSPCTDADVVPA